MFRIINNNIRFKLSLSMGMVSVSLLLVYFAYGLLISKLNDGVTNFGHSYMPALSSILNADRDLYQAYVAQLEYLQAPSATLKSDFTENAQQATDKMNVFRNKLQNQPELLSSLSQFDRLYNTWKQGADTFFQLIDQGKNEQALTLLNETNKNDFSELREIYNIGGELLDAESGKMIQQLSHESEQYQFWLLLMVTIVIIIAGGLTYLVPKLLVKGIDELTLRIKEIRQGDGDLTLRITSARSDQLGSLANEFDHLITKLQHLIKEIKDDSVSLNNSSEELISTSKVGYEVNRSQNHGIELIATAVNEFSVSVREVAQNTMRASNVTNQTTELTENGMSVVNETVKQVRELSESIENANIVITKLTQESNNIATVLDVIRSIADQTNLLALNAAIEAARAGEQGRGFAVVADEVRSLASKTQYSTNEIQKMIDTLQAGVKNAAESIEDGFSRAQLSVDSTEQTKIMFENIKNSTIEISDMVTQIASATVEQGNVSEEINSNIVNLNDQNNESLTVSENVLKVSGVVNNLSEKLNLNLKQFKVN